MKSDDNEEGVRTDPQPEVVAPTPPATVTIMPPAIAAALVKLQGEVKTIIKGAKNEHFGNTYAELKDVQELALPLLSKHGLALSQWPTSIDGKYYLRSYLVHETGVGIVDDLLLLISKNDAQGLGSSITYTRRQTTMSYLGLSAEDDDDGNKAANRQTKPTPDQISEIRQLCIDLKYSPDQVATRIASLRTEDQATVALANLHKNMSERAERVKGEENAIPVFTGDRDQRIPVEVIPGAEKEAMGVIDNLRKALMDVSISAARKRQLVRKVTGKPFLENCTPEELTKMAEVLDGIKDGSYELPTDWTDPDISPPVEAA